MLTVLGGVVDAFSSPTVSIPPSVGNSLTTTTSGGIILQVTSFTGIDYGVAKEFVYYSNASFTSYKVSELDWPLEPSFFVGTRFSAQSTFGLHAMADLRSGIPTGVGYMTDSDYLNWNGAKTHFSRHTAKLDHSIAARAEVGWRFPIAGPFSFTPFVRYLYLDIKWSAHDGYLQYPPNSESSPNYTPWSSSTTKTPLYGLIGVYQQVYSIPAIGLTAGFRLNDTLSLSGSFAYSPIASVNDVDHHVLTQVIYYDSMPRSTYLEPTISVTFRPSDRLSLTADLSYVSVVSPKNGTIVTEDTNLNSPTYGIKQSAAGSGSTAGASLQTFSFSVGLNLRL